jgi:predicted RNA-binding protein with PIN domain
MSVHYILDGYNILRQVTHLTGVKLRDDREGLLWFLLEKRPSGSPRNPVTVVFDGHGDVEKSRVREPLHVVFSNDRSADDVIVAMVGRSKTPRGIVVVSDDREVQFRVKDRGASVMSVSEFLAQAVPKEGKVAKDENDKPDPEGHSGRTITDELEKEWTDGSDGF